MECRWYFYSGITDIFKYYSIGKPPQMSLDMPLSTKRPVNIHCEYLPTGNYTRHVVCQCVWSGIIQNYSILYKGKYLRCEWGDWGFTSWQHRRPSSGREQLVQVILSQSSPFFASYKQHGCCRPILPQVSPGSNTLGKYSNSQCSVACDRLSS